MTDTLPEQFMFIGGRQVRASDEATETVLNPATGEVIATVPLGSARDVDIAVAAAAAAFEDWADTPAGSVHDAFFASLIDLKRTSRSSLNSSHETSASRSALLVRKCRSARIT